MHYGSAACFVRTMKAFSPQRTAGAHQASARLAPERSGRTLKPSRLAIPAGVSDTELVFGSRKVRLTNLNKVFWPETGATKRDLLQYYADLSPALLSHIID